MQQEPILIGFTSFDDICEHYDIKREELDKYNVLYAYYLYENWSGNSDLLLEKDGKVFWSTASHCSCYGLEGQFDPEEITKEKAEKKATFFLDDSCDEDQEKFWLFVCEYFKKRD